MDAIASLVPPARRQDTTRPSDGHQGRYRAAAARGARSRRRAQEPRVQRDHSRRARRRHGGRRRADVLPPGDEVAPRRAPARVHRRLRGARFDLGPRDHGATATERAAALRVRDRRVGHVEHDRRRMGQAARGRVAARPAARARRRRPPVRDEHARWRCVDRPADVAPVRPRRHEAECLARGWNELGEAARRAVGGRRREDPGDRERARAGRRDVPSRHDRYLRVRRRHGEARVRR